MWQSPKTQKRAGQPARTGGIPRYAESFPYAGIIQIRCEGLFSGLPASPNDFGAQASRRRPSTAMLEPLVNFV